jgi:hypothetical protein
VQFFVLLFPLFSSRRSRFSRSCPSFYSTLWKVILRVVNPISTGITASMPKVSLKGVSFVGVLIVVLYTHSTLGSSSTHILFAPLNRVLICLSKVRFVLKLDCWLVGVWGTSNGFLCLADHITLERVCCQIASHCQKSGPLGSQIDK